MTPPAAGAARSADRQSPGSRRGTVRHPRRVSGPVRSTSRKPAVAHVRAAAVALPAPGIALPKPRSPRPSAPSRRSAPRSVQDPGIALRAVGALERLSASAMLDRLIRGRVWIGLLAFALIGIVAMQLVVLKLNTGIGRTLQRQALLQRENSQLGIENSVSSAESRVAPLALTAGMTLAPTGTVHFVAANPDDVSRAASALSAATQADSGGQSQTTPAAGGEAGAGGATTEQSAAPTSEAQGSAESSSPSSTGSESAAGSSEPSSGQASDGVSPAGSSTAPATSATPSSSGATEQTAGTSAQQSSGAPTQAGGASAPAGGTQAGSQE
jgi:hypothetical protein